MEFAKLRSYGMESNIRVVVLQYDSLLCIQLPDTCLHIFIKDKKTFSPRPKPWHYHHHVSRKWCVLFLENNASHLNSSKNTVQTAFWRVHMIFSKLQMSSYVPFGERCIFLEAVPRMPELFSTLLMVDSRTLILADVREAPQGFFVGS